MSKIDLRPLTEALSALKAQFARMDGKVNMDGDSFSAWLFKVNEAIRARADNLGPYREGREWAEAAFNCNYDPKAAAYEWLRKRLDAPLA